MTQKMPWAEKARRDADAGEGGFVSSTTLVPVAGGEDSCLNWGFMPMGRRNEFDADKTKHLLHHSPAGHFPSIAFSLSLFA